MAAKLKEKWTSITTMRSKCRSIATFHRPIHSHWSLPLTAICLTKFTFLFKLLKRVLILCCLIQKFLSLFCGRQLVQYCILKPFFLFAGELLFDDKNPLNCGASRLLTPVWETPNRPPNIKWIVIAFLENGLSEKRRTHKPSSED